MLVTLRVKKYNSAFTCPKALCVIKELLCLFVFFVETPRSASHQNASNIKFVSEL